MPRVSCVLSLYTSIIDIHMNPNATCKLCIITVCKHHRYPQCPILLVSCVLFLYAIITDINMTPNATCKL